MTQTRQITKDNACANQKIVEFVALKDRLASARRARAANIL